MSADALLAEADQLLQRMTECLQAQTQVNNQTTASVRDTLKKSEQQFNAAVESVSACLTVLAQYVTPVLGQRRARGSGEAARSTNRSCGGPYNHSRSAGEGRRSGVHAEGSRRRVHGADRYLRNVQAQHEGLQARLANGKLCD